MKNRSYEAIPNYPRDIALEEIASGETKRIVQGLLALVFNDSDWRFVQNICLSHSKSKDENVRGIAILCFGHLGTFHGKKIVDIEIVKPIILEALNDPSEFVRGHAYSAACDLDLL